MTATLVLALAAGAAFGMLYFGILWRSTRSLAASGRYRAFALAAFARMALILAGLALFVRLGGGATDIAAAGAGFVAAREVFKRRVARKPAAG